MGNIDTIIDSIMSFSSPAKEIVQEQSSSEQVIPSRPIALGGQLPFLPPHPTPTQDQGKAIKFDFNFGARIELPKGRWHVSIFDRTHQVFLYSAEAEDCQIVGSKKYVIDAEIIVKNLETNEVALQHLFNCHKKNVAIFMPGGTLGDCIGWFSYAAKFSKKHQCNLFVVMSKEHCLLFEGQYDSITCCTNEDYEKLRQHLYATYYMGLFFTDKNNDWQPTDFRLSGLHKSAAYILDVDPAEEPPKVASNGTLSRPLVEPYVVIATQASSQCKYWNNPHGWHGVVTHLKSLGYAVVCIDKLPISGSGDHWNYMPHGVIDETGPRPLSERVNWLKHAAFFVGLSSGLSWLAWAARTPVVMISGFTHPTNEFYTPFRAFNPHVCNSCWHDPRVPFDHENLLFCPRYAGTDRQFECSKLITKEYVISLIDKLVDNIRH